MSRSGRESILEDIPIRSKYSDGALAHGAKELFAMSRNRDYVVGAAVPNQQRTTLCIEREDYSRAVAQKSERLIGQRLAHLFTAAVPVATWPVQIAAAD